MTNILTTGATGNVGIEVLTALKQLIYPIEIFAGVRDTKSGNEKLVNFRVKTIQFDFTNSATFNNAFQNIDILFLLRPPQISDVNKYFAPLIKAAKQSSIKHIVFLSVQGVEKSKIIPHHKIEKLIVESKIPYTFLRPAYFMQNFTNTLPPISLVSGQRSFAFICLSFNICFRENIWLSFRYHFNGIIRYQPTAFARTFGKSTRYFSAFVAGCQPGRRSCL